MSVILLAEWMLDPKMPHIIDELYVEIHYKDETMTEYNWLKFSHSREEALQLLAEMRRKGVYVHTWP